MLLYDFPYGFLPFLYNFLKLSVVVCSAFHIHRLRHCELSVSYGTRENRSVTLGRSQ